MKSLAPLLLLAACASIPQATPPTMAGVPEDTAAMAEAKALLPPGCVIFSIFKEGDDFIVNYTCDPGT